MNSRTQASKQHPIGYMPVPWLWPRSSEANLTKNRIGLVVIAIGMMGIAPLCSHAQSLDIKTGTWETTATTTIKGMLIPEEVLEKMSPEQRARVEEHMREHAAHPHTRTMRSCVTQEKLDRSEMHKSRNPNCTRKVISQTSRQLEVEETCPPPQSTKSRFKLEVQSAESYVSTIDLTQSEGGKVHVDMTGHWISADCTKDEETDSGKAQ